MRRLGSLALLGAALLGGCGSGSDDDEPEPVLPYASSVVSFEPGTDAGFGESKLPTVVLGPPQPTGNGTGAGSLDVLSLGKGGAIVLGFEPLELVDGDGADLVVFENPFWPGGDSTAVYAEPGEVSVSDDGESWFTFVCDPAGKGAGQFPGCAGVTPTAKYDTRALVPLDPALSGGDAFDLADLGVQRARYVRIRDVSNLGSGTSAGFDLDAVGLVNVTRHGAEP